MGARYESMPTSPLSVAIQHLVTDLGPDGDGMTDGELLARFLGSREEDALAALVRRHASMVWGVCRRLLNHQDAEDAFQATFLVLVRKAADVPKQAVANLLYGVARQTAVRLRATVAKHRRRERQVVNMPEPTATEDRDDDLQRAVEEELSRLPSHYRGVVVLCDLEGMTRREAARQLGIPEGSVASRLARARALLARRLTRRGLFSGGSVAALLSAGSPPPALVASTIKAASLLGAEGALGISVQVAALTEGVVQAMFVTKIKNVLAVVLVVAALACAARLVYQTQAADQPKAKEGQPAARKDQKPSEEKLRVLIDAEVARLIGQLGDDDFRVREAATENLEKIGEPAYAALRKAARENDDLEIRRRAERIVQTIEGRWRIRRIAGRMEPRFKEAIEPYYSVAFSPDGRRILSGANDHTVRLWDARTGKELRRFDGHTNYVFGVAFSQDGKRVLSGGKDLTVRLWDLETGKELRRFQGHTSYVQSVTFSPDGRRALSGANDHTVRLWDARTGKELRRFEGHTNYVMGVAFSPDGRRVLSCGLDRTVRLWDAETGKELRRFQGHTAGVSGAAFSPDGRRVLSGSWDRTLRLWDVETGKELKRFEGHTDGLTSVAFSPDGRRVLSGGNDRTVRLWDVKTGKELRRLTGHTDWVDSVAISPDGRRALSGSHDSTMRLWALSK